MNSYKLKDINIDSFPTLPTIYITLMEKLDNPKTTANDIADIILLDQSSTIRMLQLVNSSIFSFKTKINTISQAVSLIGFNEVRETLITLAVADLFKSNTFEKNYYLMELWKHSIAVGVISKIIAKELGIRNTEQYFIAGLLHDI